ncbi:hypothetical protein BVY01_04410 [bacterium I07]|nr:hypothetical protein BVY01_04410 [bacterium I07]
MKDGGQKMNKVFERVKEIVLKPRETWEKIKLEETTTNDLFKKYLLILAAVPAIANFLGRWIIGVRIPLPGAETFHFSFFGSLGSAIVGYVLTVVSVWVLAKVIVFLAPTFGSVKDELSAFKVAIYAFTPYLAAGVLYIFPSLSVLVLLAGLYSLYLLYMGLPIIMGTPKDKVLPYTVVVVIADILIWIVISVISTPVIRIFGPDLMRGM